MQFIEYISATGSQWINAGIKGSSNITFRATYMETLETSNWRALFGSRTAYDNNHFSYYYSTTTAGNNFMMGTNNNQTLFSLRNSYINKKTTIEYFNSKLRISDGTNTEEFDHSYSSAFTNAYDVHIFNMNNDNSNIDAAADIRLYKLEFYSNGALVRDFYPAKDNNGVPGLYDTISKIFFYNSGTGTFGMGAVVGPEYKNNESIMLEGQTAYYKKSGSMKNYGKLTLDNQEVTNTYGPGFIDEGSTIGAAKLETADDYKQTLNDMRIYLSDDFIADSEDYLVKVNAENIADNLSTRSNELAKITSHMGVYTDLPYLKCENMNDRLDMELSIDLSNDFVLSIASNLLVIPDESYDLIRSDSFTLSQSATGVFELNGVEIPSITHTENDVLNISQHSNYINISINDNTLYYGEGFEGDTSITLNTKFSNYIKGITVYNSQGLQNEVLPRYNSEDRTSGLLSLIDNMFYVNTTKIKLFTYYDQTNIYSGGLDLEYSPGPNTGIEIKYNQWSSQSSNVWKGIIGCFSGYSVANTISFGIMVGDSGNIYASRNNNITAWKSSGKQASLTSSTYTITLNKNNDHRFIGTSSDNSQSWNIDMGNTATNSNNKNQSLWLCGYNDIGRYIPMQYMDSSSWIPGYSQDMRVWYIKIYEGNELVRYYIPGADLNGNKGMIDILHAKMYSNKKCSFSTGTVIPEPEI